MLGKKTVISGLSVITLILWLISIWWGWMPSSYDVKQKTNETAQLNNENQVAGYTTTSTLIDITEWLITKPGGFISNDMTPPGILMDNMPAFEYGVLEQARDLALAMRLSFSRSQSQSKGDKDLETAQSKLNISHKSWQLPSAENEYGDAIKALKSYRSRLVSQDNRDAQFYTRADNLGAWLREVEKRLGSISQELSASVGYDRFDTTLSGDPTAKQSTATSKQLIVKTSWWKIDDVFYESRGATWAILHFLKAVEVDFADVLEKKNAQASLKQIIRDLESTQDPVWTPMILNGSGFGLLANHSLVMANYVSRANAALIDLRSLLEQG
ncbi:DUF2333 domain-containing protein [Psychromonas sp. psych-6C06]|uniref:DUF2333 family protein n=1 Tax=Psychromonas sp. psych-6C06 TaxID=2058089 RepID=UPI000C320B0B|nr:DUF2333 family protein [Psychromonas sp. psych-6C06]PKF62640.1 DUF2333 domain-containing protein [Psychromonas sp. psych-6C06]